MPTWMVIEDEPDIYDVILAMFELWGIEGIGFVDGAEAIGWIEDVDAGRFQGELPELVITDIRLPEASGPMVAERFRKSPPMKDIVVILMTAYRLSPDEQMAAIEQAGADYLMYKPSPPMPQFKELIDDLLAKNRWWRGED